MNVFSRGFYLGRRGVKVKPLSFGKQFFRLIIFALILALIAIIAGHALANRLLFYPVKGLEATFKNTGWPYEELWLTRPKGQKVFAWYLPGPPGAYVTLLLHGNGGNLDDMVGRVLSYHHLNMGVLAIDYPGYGLSEGEPSLASAVESAVLAWDYLVNVCQIEPQKIVVHGFSLGGGVAGQLLARRPAPHPIIMDSTFTSLAEAAGEAMPLLKPLSNVILGDSYDTLAVLRDYKATKALFFHSPQDEVVPYKLGEALFNSYQNGPKSFTRLAGPHVNFISNQSAYEKAIIESLGLVFPPYQPPTPNPE
ncbi:MAG: alpha/beta hydrolase [Deltaproteobacteria bacterium]|nr:alpha/beta hydrolase [Deltaproteobacteria bacterium]